MHTTGKNKIEMLLKKQCLFFCIFEDRLGQGKTHNTEKNAIEMILQEKLTLH